VEKLIVFRKRKEHPEHELLNVDELAKMSHIFTGRWGRLLARAVIAVCDVSKLNVLYDQVYFEEGPECASKLLHYMDCDYRVGNAERLSQLPEGAFIVVSNQPYGALDAIILIDMIGGKRPDFKLLASQMFSRIKPLSDSFVYMDRGGAKEQYAEAARHVAQGAPVGIFPSGVGSDYKSHPRQVIDRPWNLNTIRFIQEAHLPIVPIRFLDRNSRLYYWLGYLGLPMRLLRLPSELFNKSKGVHRVVIGNTITLAEQSRYVRPTELHDHLWQAIYDMPVPEDFVQRSTLTQD
ncbi:MAG: 1-acyl-sn-glycerol-3-phosphate acyltransferase, partial [Bacteroidaceae bacterium]|nr:1-acyl-sn-glycerol-3-phosphate acyltransferase [Bacteroidaceae bacterium]